MHNNLRKSSFKLRQRAKFKQHLSKCEDVCSKFHLPKWPTRSFSSKAFINYFCTSFRLGLLYSQELSSFIKLVSVFIFILSIFHRNTFDVYNAKLFFTRHEPKGEEQGCLWGKETFWLIINDLFLWQTSKFATSLATKGELLLFMFKVLMTHKLQVTCHCAGRKFHCANQNFVF